eukprot:3852411-Rhodomonas_salina.1
MPQIALSLMLLQLERTRPWHSAGSRTHCLGLGPSDQLHRRPISRALEPVELSHGPVVPAVSAPHHPPALDSPPLESPVVRDQGFILQSREKTEASLN